MNNEYKDEDCTINRSFKPGDRVVFAATHRKGRVLRVRGSHSEVAHGGGCSWFENGYLVISDDKTANLEEFNKLMAYMGCDV